MGFLPPRVMIHFTSSSPSLTSWCSAYSCERMLRVCSTKAYICWDQCKVARCQLLPLLAVLADYSSSTTDSVDNCICLFYQTMDVYDWDSCISNDVAKNAKWTDAYLLHHGGEWHWHYEALQALLQAPVHTFRREAHVADTYLYHRYGPTCLQ